MRAIRNGDPLPQAPQDGWAREDLEHAQKSLWEQWGIHVDIHTEECGQAQIGPCPGQGKQVLASFQYRWSCLTGRLHLNGATKSSLGKGREIARRHAMAHTGCIAYRASRSHEGRLRAIDHNIHRPPKPGLSDVKAALGWLPYPRMMLGLAPHPVKGAAISSSTLRMPNLTQLLNGFARGENPSSHYTTISIQRS